MDNYDPPYNIDDEMLDLVSSISEKAGQVTLLHGLDSRPHLRKNNKIRSVYSSLHIEANSLSLDEVRAVVNGRTIVGPIKEIQEVKNAYSAYQKISEIDPCSQDDLKRFHAIMTAYLIDESGVYRKGEEGVFNGEECIFMAPPARLIPHLMDDLFRWLNESQGKVHPLIQSAVFHYEFVFIHPFSDGNGRMARLWHTAILTKWRPVFEYIPLESQIEKFQNGYYEAISACHRNGNSNSFILFILRQLNSALDEFLVSAGNTKDFLSQYESRLLSAMQYDRPYTCRELLELLGLKSRETLRKYYLNPVIEKNLVRMTIPEKPHSRNQRYIKV